MTRLSLARGLMAVVVSATLLLASTGSVLAKFPYFSVSLDTAAPRPEQPITVTVRTWADAAHSEPAGFAYEGRYEGLITDLIEFQLVGDGEGPRRLPIALDMVKVDLFRGEVWLPAGEWRLVAFPHGRGALGDFGPGYPDPIHVVVADEPGAAGLVLSLAAGAVALLLALWSARTRTSRARVARPSTSAP